MSIRNAFFKFTHPASGSIGRWLSFAYLIGIIIGPVVFLTLSISEGQNVPWYFVLLTSVLLLSSVVFGVFRFRQNEAEDISIRPDSQ